VVYSWRFTSDTAESDARYYYFYYKPNMQSPFVCVDSLESSQICYPASCEYHLSGDAEIVGCFAMTVADSNRNVTAMSDTTCFDIYDCLEYRFPNVFTPNGDGVNDLFTPFLPYHGVVKVDMRIYNRWGKRVFSTSDPDILWDGSDTDTFGTCSDGVYYYSCDVFVNTLTGQMSYSLHGSVTLIR
jgi:gliding motility-associated-like protein